MPTLKRTALILILLISAALACRLAPPSDDDLVETDLARDVELTVTARLATEEAAATQPPPTEPALPPTAPPQANPPPSQPTPESPQETLPPQQPPSPQPSEATVEIVNNLSRQLTVLFKGPETRSFIIFPSSKMEVELLPGEYEFTLTAPGFDTSTGTVTFDPGENTWTIGRAN